MEKYKVLNPNTGLYDSVDTLEEAEMLAKEIAWKFYNLHCHGKPISKVIVNDDGSEVWS